MAKKKAAEGMLETLKKIHPVTTTEPKSVEGKASSISIKSKAVVNKKKPKNLVKVTVSYLKRNKVEIENILMIFSFQETVSSSNGTNSGRTQDPISQLVQLQQSRKEKEPVFVVISEKGIPRQPEFVVRCTVASIVVEGIGPKKRDAKKAAALKALEALTQSDIKDESSVFTTKSLITDDLTHAIQATNQSTGKYHQN